MPRVNPLKKLNADPGQQKICSVDTHTRAAAYCASSLGNWTLADFAILSARVFLSHQVGYCIAGAEGRWWGMQVLTMDVVALLLVSEVRPAAARPGSEIAAV